MRGREVQDPSHDLTRTREPVVCHDPDASSEDEGHGVIEHLVINDGTCSVTLAVITVRQG